MNRPYKTIFASLLITVLAGCVNYVGISSNKKIAPPSRFQTSKSLPQQNGCWPTENWAKQFGDPQLVALVNEALTNNPSLEVALARIQQARAVAEQKASTLYPQGKFSAAVTRTHVSTHELVPPPVNKGFFTQSGFIARASYTLDLWGKNRSQLRQALADVKASEAEGQQARLIVATSVASTYNELAHYYDLRDVLRRTVAQREALERITVVRVRTGLDTRVQYFQSRNTSATARTDLVRVEGQIVIAKQQLGTLVGGGPDRGLLITRPRLPIAKTPALPANLPLALLGRRPDIVSARWQVESACQGINYTKALFYPNVNLMAGVGFLSLKFHIESRGNAEYFGPALTLPIFDGGALRGQLRQQYGKYEEAVGNYNNTLNEALSEVSSQVTNIRVANKQLKVQKDALINAEHAYNLARYQYKIGLASQLVVLDAETRYLTEQQSRLQLVLNRRNLQVALIQALGGGFDARMLECCRVPNKNIK
ncbi:MULTISPECIES: efflux transporter outer membrane subunit [Legionella]|uniref:Outer membrane efflux protein n=1 Tax=Legionella drozanskii LLAP-1 TaxID=1212489 RepID=A0A0W0SKQ4_9GAMM|nr:MULTISPECIES: efflux transporter outer membrane subunit [Legionella]KTC84002.1 outer membrane efflux protein [Legionella drozanskii LLAP-1]